MPAAFKGLPMDNPSLLIDHHWTPIGSARNLVFTCRIWLTSHSWTTSILTASFAMSRIFSRALALRTNFDVMDDL